MQENGSSSSGREWPQSAGARGGTSWSEALIAIVVKSWRRIGLICLVAAVGAYGLSILLPARYTATATFIPARQGNSKIAALSQLTGGLGLEGTSSAESPVFYSRLAASHGVLARVVQADLDGHSLLELYELGETSADIQRAVRRLRKSLSISVDRIPGIIRIDVEMRDAQLAAAVASRILKFVDEANSNMRRRTAAETREFLEVQLADAAAKLRSSEAELEEFLRKNRLLDSPFLVYEKTRLDRRINVAQDLYLVLSRQMQTAQIDELNNTAAISVVDLPYVPVRPSAPRPALMVFVAVCVAGALSVLILLIKRRHDWLESIPEQG